MVENNTVENSNNLKHLLLNDNHLTRTVLDLCHLELYRFTINYLDEITHNTPSLVLGNYQTFPNQ